MGQQGILNAERLCPAPSCSGHRACLPQLGTWSPRLCPSQPGVCAPCSQWLSVSSESLRHLAQVQLTAGHWKRPRHHLRPCRAHGIWELVQHWGQGPASMHVPRERWSPAKVATPVSPSSRMSLQNSRLVNPTAPGLLESTSDFWLQKIIPRPTQAKIWEGLRPSSLPPSPPARLVASAFHKGPEASAGPLATPARSPGTLLHSTWRHLSSSETGLLHSP